ncbi:multiple sugar transport system permease protein [Clostridium saccharoperbutylacetonicum]|uniref:L-arabinose transport system permease protein AraQ n=1 Tax=Clostridium saccharoperbutylacetonicum N1-4(HMT) TaxID=931276 RepID=M1MX73_9CLOT|nr:carbohydrate ABC transporter permease [Clostridium saccharoperbutylacetonicum]AGF56072.1 L-arabinose transport system permease protein AraQ [Clostridium saccharoperbutylacetonicum N1-4(HMT)]NRT63188.1 multiple sugar transport system permease protein [Clostridium saccharoperbutylacetonicum]NSB26548.1 multiple sugar transport system permease protein [Clostridium saccharoperbutylacetonicum]NSB45898.1 multiple sugar transport system permease protein [Clostridium saccharoperbutylacetonicum]
MTSINRKMNTSKLFIHLFLIVGVVIMILPFVWMVLTSFKTVSESTSMNPFVIFPSEWKVENYLEAIRQNDFIILYFNTFAMMALRIICSVGFSAMAAYAFARLKFPGRDFLFGIVLFQMMVPVQLFIIPQYLMVDKIGMRNTVFALLFPGLVSAFGTFLLRQFFMGIPKELEESARLDGCNIGQTFVKVMLPLTKSGLVALGIFTALFAFKDLMWPLIVNSSADAATLSSALAKIQSAYSVNYPQLMAASVLAIWPMLAIYIVFQKQFIEGIATSGGKL